jgi:protein ImuA
MTVHHPSFSGLPDRRDRIATLRRQIPGLVSDASVISVSAHRSAWRLGLDPGDRGPGDRGPEPGLDQAGVHEVRPLAPGQDGCAATAAAVAGVFALLLMVRRRLELAAARSGFDASAIAWCAPEPTIAETGLLHGPGLARLGLDPARLVLVRARTRLQTLWAMEESLKSKSLAGVIGLVADADLTEARRLALAADAGGTPCLVVTGARSPCLGATAARWMVGPVPSAPHPFDRAAPGALRFAVTLDRSRLRPPLSLGVAHILEWCHAASRFRLASGVADRTVAPPGAAGAWERRGPQRLAGGL